MNRLPRRLVIDGRRLTTGRTGVGRYLECLLREWASSELPAEEVFVVLADRSGLEFVPEAPGFSARVVAPGLPGLIWERFGLAPTFRPGDLLFAPTNLLPRTWRGPTVLVMFDALQEVRPADFAPLIRWRFGRRYRRAILCADRVIVPSLATAHDLVRVYGITIDRLTVIHPAADRTFRPLPPDAPEVIAAHDRLGLDAAPFFLFVGKRSRRRNIPSILSAFAVHRRLSPESRLIFVGDATGRSFGEGRHPERVIDAGHVPEKVLHGLMASAIAVLYPSEHEGFGLPVVEAMASGCPVVTLRRDALVEAGGEGPIYLDRADPESLANAMTRLATDPIARAKCVEVGLREAARFSMSNFAGAVTREIRRAWDGSAAQGFPDGDNAR